MSILRIIESYSDKTKIYFSLYLFCFVVSVWASGESFSKSFGFSILCYIAATVIMLLASFCLKLVWQSTKGKHITNLPQFIFGFTGFLFAWILIFTANTHNFYYISTNDDQKQKEIQEVKNLIDTSIKNSLIAFKSAKSRVNNDLEIEIKNLKEELLNINNQGHGPKVNEIILRIEKKLGAEIDLLSNPPKSSFKLKKYGNTLAEKIRAIGKTKVEIIDDYIKEVEAIRNDSEFKRINEILNDLTNNYDDKSQKERNVGIKNAYAYYYTLRSSLNERYSRKVIKDHSSLQLEDLPNVPKSIRAKHISFVWNSLSNNQIEDKSNFIWAASIAFLFDFACFLIWYFFVLPSIDEDY